MIVDEHGDRRAPLLADPAADEHPAFAPGGGWLVFARGRDRTEGRPRLWVAPAVAEAPAVPVTDGLAREVDPVWAPDGSIIFASDRDGGGDLDLYRLPMVIDRRGARPAGPPVALTDGPGQELAPTVAAGRVIFQVIERDPPRSFIAARTVDGAVVALTDGPADGSPVLSPDGRYLAYVTARVRADGGRDLDVVVEALDPDADDAATRARAPSGIGLEATDEGAPAWSVDGRWLFATSIVRDVEGALVLASVVHVDTWERAPRVRMLRDQVGAIPRLGVAIAPTILDAAALGRNPDYLPALAEALTDLADQRAEAERARRQRVRRRDPL